MSSLSASAASQISFQSPSGATLGDLLTLDQRASIFFDYVRSSASLSPLLDASAPSNTTLFVPANSAIMSLPRKPHQGSPPSSTGVAPSFDSSRAEEEDRRAYLEKWVARYVVPKGISMEVGQKWETLIEGKTVGFEKEGDEVTVVPGNIKIRDVVEASNGRYIVLESCLSP